MKSMTDGKRRENAEDVTRHSHAKRYQNASTGTTCWSRVFWCFFFLCKVRQIINLAALSPRLWFILSQSVDKRNAFAAIFLFSFLQGAQPITRVRPGDTTTRGKDTMRLYKKHSARANRRMWGRSRLSLALLHTWDLRLTNQLKPLPAQSWSTCGVFGSAPGNTISSVACISAPSRPETLALAPI